MSIKLSWMPRVAIAVWLSVIFTLCLAQYPQKYEAADMFAVALLMLATMAHGAQLPKLVSAINPPCMQGCLGGPWARCTAQCLLAKRAPPR